jgi:DNA-binding NtrC family response regulator
LSADLALRIFVVDDERVISDTLAKILQLSGYEAIPFTNPLEALNDAQFHSPDLLLSDVSMPELSGVDLAVQMRLKYPNCKILLFSGQASTEGLENPAVEELFSCSFNRSGKTSSLNLRIDAVQALFSAHERRNADHGFIAKHAYLVELAIRTGSTPPSSSISRLQCKTQHATETLQMVAQ